MAETYEQVERQRNHFRREMTELSKQRDDLMEQAALHMRQAAELLDRNRELTRQVEQLRARVDAAEKLVHEWRNRDWFAEVDIWGRCADELESALTAPPSSAPTDPGLADTAA